MQCALFYGVPQGSSFRLPVTPNHVASSYRCTPYIL
jgi:hypothetical protein